jgi:hypothetical protein
MTVAGSIAPSASTCTLPPPVPGGGPTDVPPGTTPPGASGGGPAELGAAVEQLRVAVDQLAQVVNSMTAGAAGGGASTTGGGGSGCGMSGCGGSTDASGGGAALGAAPPGGGGMGAPTAGANAAPSAPRVTGGGAPAPAAAAAPAGALNPSDAQLAKDIDAKVFAGTGLAGKGAVLVDAARKYHIPIDFALAVYQKEAGFAKSGTLADRNNNPGNLRFADWQSEHGGAPNGGFTKYPTMDDGIRASMHLLSMGRYKDAVARRDWGAVISIYAPSSENNTDLYIKQMNEYTANFRQKLGISENWVNG